MEKAREDQLKMRPVIKRKRGAQPGNSNALKHGFYSHRFNKLELSDLGTVVTDNLDDEIALLRVVMRRVFDLANVEADGLETWILALGTLGAASTRLAGLIRTQHLSTGKSQDIEDLLADVIGVTADEISKVNQK